MRFSDDAVARQVSDLMLEIAARLDQSLITIQATASTEEFSQYRGAVGRIMGDILLEVLNPLYAEHPHFRPKEFI